MQKGQVIILARELLKIRISAAREGPAEDDGVHASKVKAIPFYDDDVMAEWYRQALRTAEIIIALEEEYLTTDNYKHFDNPR
jgi:hypothetical protein